VESATPVRNVLCLPVFGGSLPAASVVLVTVGNKSFNENDIRTLDKPLRELATLIEAMRRAASAGGKASYADTEPAAETPAGVARPPSDEGHASRQDARTRSLAASLARAQQEQARLQSELLRARGAVPGEQSRIQELTAEVDRLRAELAEGEA